MDITPSIIPNKTGNHTGSLFEISLAGKISENILTEIRIPAANPRLLILNLGCTSLVKNTVAAPSIVMNHMAKVTTKVKVRGPMLLTSNSIIACN